MTRSLTRSRTAHVYGDADDQRFRLSFEFAPIGMALVDMEGTCIEANPAFGQIVGYAREALIGTPRQLLVHPDDLDGDEACVAGLLAGEYSTFVREKRYLHADGHVVWVSNAVTLVRDARGRPDQLILQVQDITARRRQEQALRDSEATLRTIVEHAPAAIVLRDVAGRYQHVNPRAAASLGLKVEDLVGRSPSDHCAPDLLGQIEAQDEELIRTKEPILAELTIRHDDGSLHDYHVVKYPVLDTAGAVIGLGSFSLDITARKQAERLAGELAAIIASTGDAVIGKTIEGEITSWNAGAERIYGYSAEETVGRHISLLSPPGREEEFSMIAAMLRAGSLLELETVRRRKDGTLIEVALTVSPIRDPAGEIVGASTIARDVTEKKMLTRQLAVSERLLRTTIDRAPIGISVITHDRKLLSVNQTLCAMTGFSEQEIKDRWPEGLVHPDDQESRRRHLAPLLSGEVDEVAFEERYLHADGNPRRAHVAIACVRDERGRPAHFVAQFQDITQRHDDEQRLRVHAREQEALRALATLVASEAEPRLVYRDAARRAAEILDADFSAVASLSPTCVARLLGSWSAPGLPATRAGALLDLSGGSALCTAMRTGRPANFPRYDRPLEATEVPSRSALAAPIMVNGSVWGAISVGWTREDVADDAAAKRIARVADLVSLAISGAEARAQLSRLASTDHLTGLYNQRAFFDRLETEVARAQRHGRQLSLIVMDLDHFKLVNDTYGHEAGNRVLVEFSQRLLSVRRHGEILARIGGEEFAWILPGTSGDQARAAAERARGVIADAEFEGIAGLTASLGVCSLEDADDAAELFRHADLALYWSKSSGRDLSTRYHPEEVSLVTAAQQRAHLRHAQALAAVRALAAAVDAKDPGTQRHSERVAMLSARMAVAAGWPEHRVGMLREVALVHDVGKIAIPDRILLKRGRLTTIEYEQIKAHASLGAQMLVDLLTAEQIDWIRHHHERLDGGGYPDALTDADIPEGARLLAVADAWDAMTMARSYGKPRTATKALSELERNAGSQFCPRAVDLLARALSGDELPQVVPA